MGREDDLDDLCAEISKVRRKLAGREAELATRMNTSTELRNRLNRLRGQSIQLRNRPAL